MKIKLTIDSTGIDRALRDAKFTEQDMLDLIGSPAKVVINTQRQLVPVDTATTKVSISEHIVESSNTKVVDDVGPETDYAVHLEYGTGEFAEGGKGRKGGWFYKDENGWHFTKGMHPRPFVRPSILENGPEILRVLASTFVELLRQKWPI